MFNPDWQLNNSISHFRHPLDIKPTQSKENLKSVGYSKSLTSAKEVQDIKRTQPKLSMIWVEESNGSKKSLVARWVVED